MEHQKSTDGFGLVNFITDWWDGPKSGFADYNGSIHSFERIFDEQTQDWTLSYWLRPVSNKEYLLQKESYTLFLEWLKNNDKARVHPLEDMENIRYQELRQLLAEFEHRFYNEEYIGEFIATKIEDKDKFGINGFNIYTVKWTRKDGN